MFLDIIEPEKRNAHRERGDVFKLSNKGNIGKGLTLSAWLMPGSLTASSNATLLRAFPRTDENLPLSSDRRHIVRGRLIKNHNSCNFFNAEGRKRPPSSHPVTLTVISSVFAQFLTFFSFCFICFRLVEFLESAVRVQKQNIGFHRASLADYLNSSLVKHL